MTDTLLGITFDCTMDETYNEDKFRIDREHTATYLFQMDSDSDREDDVDGVTGCPQIGDSSPIVTGAKCIKRSFRERSPRIWEVEATFSSNYASEPSDTNPWSRDIEWSWSFETIEEPLLFDAQTTTKAIQNSALDPLPPITRPIAVPVLTISRYESSFSGSTILDYVNYVNDATFWGAGAGKVLCAGITATQETQSGTTVWKVVYVFKFKMDSYGW